MGKVLSVARTTIKRKASRFNVESRAQKILEKEKPTPAPMHPRAKEQLERLKKEYPEAAEEQNTIDPSFQSRLKDVYVKSHDPLVPDPFVREDSSKLPQSRQTVEETEFGFYEPEIVPVGRVSLRQAIKFIGDHQADPKIWTIEAIAKHYKLDIGITGQILQHYRTFQLYIPPTKDEGKALPQKKSESIESGKKE